MPIAAAGHVHEEIDVRRNVALIHTDLRESRKEIVTAAQISGLTITNLVDLPATTTGKRVVFANGVLDDCHQRSCQIIVEHDILRNVDALGELYGVGDVVSHSRAVSVEDQSVHRLATLQINDPEDRALLDTAVPIASGFQDFAAKDNSRNVFGIGQSSL